MRRHHFRSKLIVLLCLLPACRTAGPATSTVDPAAALASRVREIPLEPYVAGLHTIEVEVGGRKLPFLFDTAGGVTLLTLQTARLAGCLPFGRDVGFRNDGSRIELQRCRGVRLAIDDWRTRDEEVAVWDLMKLLQGAPEVGGLISLRSFEGEIVTLDWPRQVLRIETKESLPAAIRGASELRIRDARQAGGGSLDLFVAVDSPRGQLWFELDSGSTGQVLVAPHTAELLGTDLPPGEVRDLVFPVHGLGDVTLPARLRESIIYDGLFGVGFFEPLVVTIDLERMRAWARRAAP